VCLAGAAPLRAESLDYFLPADETWDERVPSPAAALGYEIGDRHIHHHELVDYLRRLADASPRVQIEEYGRTHGRRPLVALTITSPANHERLEDIRRRHRRLADPAVSGDVEIDHLPAVLWMGYSVHGDEASAGNAAPLIAYYLAAGQSERVTKLLDDVVVLLDPCLNPDGFERFAQWANGYRGRAANADPATAEHVQAWPGGRVNYYWFDLNRDWVPVQHPESQGRVRRYHRWKPNVLLDFHEMGSSSTFYFAPGEPKRNHPRMPPENLDLSHRLAEFHARALDRIGSLYFTQQRFDDFYPGKGSSYPDLHGGIGTLFEQGSSRGLVQETPHGKLTFAFTIRNQVTTSLSSLAGTQSLRVALHEYKRQFFRDALAEAERDPVRYHAYTAPGDRARLEAFADVLRRHDIRSHWLKTDRTIDVADGGGATASAAEAVPRLLRANETLLVPTRQPEYRFLRALIDTQTTFEEDIFYDVSAWTLPLAFDLNHTPLQQPVPEEALVETVERAVPFTAADSDYAYAIDARSLHVPRLLRELLDREIKVRVAEEPFQAVSGDKTVAFECGTLLVPLGLQPEKRAIIVRTLTRAAERGVRAFPIATGLTPEGIDLGSGSLRPIEAPKVLMVIDGGVARYAAGSTWHWLDTHVGLPVTLIPQGRLGQTELTGYTTIILPDGTYGSLSTGAVEKLGAWVSAGGTLIASGAAIPWVVAQKLANVDLIKAEGAGDDKAEQPVELRLYICADDDQALREISGAIFNTRIDRTHPICYGLSDDELSVFRDHTMIMKPTDNAYSNPVRYTDAPLLSGYSSPANLQRLAGSASVVVRDKGDGRVILMAEEMTFRGHWYATSRLLTNAIFYGSLIREP
jgi:hypothetical protein